MLSTDSSGKTVVMIIDDDKTTRDVVGALFRGQGDEYNVIPAKNAEEAQDILLTTSPHIINCDIIMPGLNGFELCNIIKSDELQCDIPFIFLSSKERDEDKMLGFELGADDYIVKPFNPKELIMRVRKLISRYKINATSIHHPFRLKGSLLINSASDILQLPSVATRKQGTLVIYGEERKLLGALYLKEGKIINAVYLGGWGLESAYKLINTKEGSFKYFPTISNKNIEPVINKPIISILLESARQSDTGG